MQDGERHEGARKPKARPFFAFSRTAFGIVKVRTDGERLLVLHQQRPGDLKEAYAYKVSAGTVVADRISKV